MLGLPGLEPQLKVRHTELTPGLRRRLMMIQSLLAVAVSAYSKGKTLQV